VTRRAGETFRLGPCLTPAGETVIEATEDRLSVTATNGLALATDVTGRLTHLHLVAERCAVVLPSGPAGGWLDVTVHGQPQPARATLDGDDLAYDAASGRVTLPASETARRIEITFERP
jgi:hypothetical protein